MTDAPARCDRCDRPATLCVCDRMVTLETRTEVVILQHPQERDRDLGTAPLLTAMLPKARVVVGLSWASLAHAIGREAEAKRWGVLYTGSLPRPLPPEMHAKPAVILNRKGEPREEILRLEGILALDGSWSQAKTLWWRNAWLLKLPRVVLHPVEPSIYGKMRKEPRREALSTLEAVALALVANGEDPASAETLRRVFRTMIQRARDHAPPPRPGPGPRIDRRRRGRPTGVAPGTDATVDGPGDSLDGPAETRSGNDPGSDPTDG